MEQILQTMIKIQMPKLLHFFFIWGIIKKILGKSSSKSKTCNFILTIIHEPSQLSSFQIDTNVSGTTGHTCGAAKIVFDDVDDSDATDCDDVDDTDDTGEIKTEPEVKIQLLLNNAMAATTKGE